MKKPNKRLLYAIELSAVALGIFLFGTYESIRRAETMEQWVAHTHNVLLHTGRITLLSVENEINARNFMLTGYEKYTEQFDRTRAAAQWELRVIGALTSDNYHNRLLFDSVSLYVTKRADFSARIISMRRAYGLDGSVKLVQSGEGEGYAEKALTFIRRLEKNENLLLAERRAGSDRASATMNTSITISMLFVILLVGMLLYRARKNSVRRGALIEELERSEANLHTIFDHTDMSYVLIDAEVKVVSFNKPAMAYSKEQNHKTLEVGQSVIDYFPPSKRQGIRETLKKVSEGATIRYEYSLLQADGSLKWFEVKWVNVTGINKQHRGFILANKDITEKKVASLEREKIITDLIARNKTMEEFTYIVSHNLRAPVANIIGLGEILEILDADSPDREAVTGYILSSVNDLDQVVKDLNQVLQVREEVNEKKEAVFFSDIVNEIRSSIPLISSKNTIIECDFSEADHMHTLRNYLYSIFYNLIINSVKYSRKDVTPMIRLKTARKDHLLEISFEDNGKGIDLEKNQSTLFGLYRRFDYSVEGKGIGLFMVKTQVELLGGNIQVKSEVDKGTEFRIVLPVGELEKQLVTTGAR
ncbi:sensor histidine kinase [Hufsiella ginkgonis]|uniref:histidine kinase n=1 Tax=Hufsiella ginkgonis TaxID=2695274 RepID=A0A7K1XUL8_9SPHI|nr:CHASE3 domain-containing protein [Hufsiella ginkgonis]MXV14497.1 PAS domain S-box protein [Hufsiella ginkgonis]